MSVHNIGIRKYVELNRVRYWLLINAKSLDENQAERTSATKMSTKVSGASPIFINSASWKIFIVITVLLNTFTMCMLFTTFSDIAEFYMWLLHLHCLFYWVDFVGGVMEKIYERRKKRGIRTRSTAALVVDAISLIPLSLAYMLKTESPNVVTFILLRAITVLRVHRVLNFFYNYTMNANHHWKLILLNHIIIMAVLSHAFYIYVFTELEEFNPEVIHGWNSTSGNRSTVSWYLTVQTVLSVGYGDLTPTTTTQRLICIVVTILGCSQMGIITGTLTTAFSNSDKVRERYRDNYEATMKLLKDRKIDKKTLDKISDNIMTRWKYNRGYTNTTDIQILPRSMQKEVFFDINFGLLNRSLLFSTQPRSFLRSVSVFMKNVSYLPGEIIMEPFGMTDAMLCVASGVIEVLSEENDETVLFSLTSGTIIGEATLFISIPIRCIIRASTYVELQVLMKVHFSRLALNYPEIIRSMRSEIYYRLNFQKFNENENTSELDSEFQALSRRKETKRFLQDLRRKQEKVQDGKKFRVNAYKAAILSLYVLSENIPSAKTLPIQLIRGKPWILRPNTILLTLWNIFIVLLVSLVAFIYPFYAAFERRITSALMVFMFITEAAYIVDLYLECTTAIERKDKFTFITSIREIVSSKLKKFGFYSDVLATYDLSIYAKLNTIKHQDYAALLLSLNKVLKLWRVFTYFQKLEDNMKSILILVRTTKHLFFLLVFVFWGAAAFYIEACPWEVCLKERWFAHVEAKDDHHTKVLSIWPSTLSLYFAAATLFGVAYGDVSPTSTSDIWIDYFLIIGGVFTLIVCMSQASSTFKYIARERSNYQAEVFAVDRFMIDHEIPKHLKHEVSNYFQLQWNYDKGFFLMNDGSIEELPPQQRHVIVNELMKPFLTVPLFRSAGNDFLRVGTCQRSQKRSATAEAEEKSNIDCFQQVLVRSSKVRILQPNDIIAEANSPIREMFILENGYCEVKTEEESKIIGPVNPFGYYEMIVGTPLKITVKTLTHARFITLNYAAYHRAVTKYPGVKIQIDDIIEKEYKTPKNNFETLGFPPIEDIDPQVRKVQRQKELLSKQIINVHKYNTSLGLSYWQPFNAWGKFRFLQFLFLPFVISPQSLFIKIWTTLRVINVIMIGLVAPVYFSLPNHMQMLQPLMSSLQIFAAIDMYLMFHVAYYDSRGLLMFHPAKTVVWYLKGTFAFDLFTLIPHYWILRKVIPPKNNTPSIQYDGLGLITVLQFYKFIQSCIYLDGDILRQSEILKILKFVPVAVIMNNLITGIMVLIECFHFEHINIPKNPESNRLSVEWKESINAFCTPDTLQTNETLKMPIFKMYLTTLYWVTQTTAGCGFGDITAINETTMIASIVIIFLGFFLYMYMFADLTSGMITAYVLVTKYRRKIWEMSTYAKEKNIDPILLKRMVLHYEYNWQRSEGANPQKVFTCVHTALRQSIIASIYQATVQEIPGFSEVAKSVIRIIGQHLNEMYFLQGEVILNHLDIQEHIYMLYRGKVQLFSKSGTVIATMDRGGLFGNVSNTPFSVSSVMAVAMTNVDVLRLDYKTFFKALQISPNAKKLFDFLTNTKRDYIEPLNVSQGRSSALHISLIGIETIPYEMTTVRSVRPFMNYSDTNLTAVESSFHFKNSIFKMVGKRICTFVILPETALSNIIEITVVILAYISSNLTVYSLAFQDVSNTVLIISYVLDFFFYVKIGLQYHLSYFDKFGDYVVNSHMIMKRYHKSKTMIYDILSNLPLEIFALIAPKKWQLSALSVLRLNRVLRLGFILEYHRIKLQTLMVNKIYLELCWILICTTLLIHFFTCLWYFVACPLGKCYTPCFVSEMNLLEAGRFELYLISLYYIILLVTAVSYSGIPLYSTPELVLSVILIISCRFAVVLLLGTLTAAINAQNAHLYLYQERITRLRESFFHQNISEYQIGKMWNYVQSLWFFKSGSQLPKFITTAPYAMRCEVMNEMFGSHLAHSYIFSELDKEFLRQLAIYLKRFVYFPGNYIVQQGDIDHTMYFIHKGMVSVLTIHPDLMETTHFTLSDGDNFGMIQGLVVGTPHQFSYRAQTDVVVLSLTLSHWKHLLKYFPKAGQKIYKKLQTLPSHSNDPSPSPALPPPPPPPPQHPPTSSRR